MDLNNWLANAENYRVDRRPTGTSNLAVDGSVEVLLCPRGLRGLPVGKDRERRGWVEFIRQDWKGGKRRRAKGAFRSGNRGG